MDQKILIKQFYKLGSTHLFVQVLSIILGSIFLSAMAQIAFYLPWTPIPITMQTLGISILAMTLGPKYATSAVLLYLGQATIGLPVLAAGRCNPLWIIGPTAGYLIGFLIAAYAVGQLFKKHNTLSIYQVFIRCALNEIIILFSGTIWLYLTLQQDQAFQIGMLPFIPGALCKICLATGLFHPIKWTQTKI